MFSRYLHCIDQSGLHSYLDAKGGLKPLADFPDSTNGATQFSIWLDGAHPGTHTLLVDLPDEGFQRDSIPFVSGADRQRLLTRKKGQIFAGSPFSTTISLGREKEGRRDERVLFTAITRTSVLDPWLLVLRQHNAPLAALYSVPLLTTPLVNALPAEASHTPHGLIISFSPGGIRQTYFENAALRFSRLSPAPDGDYIDWGEACLNETRKTLQYLTTQRWITRHQRLPVWLLLDPHDSGPILGQLTEAEQLDLHPVNLTTLVHQFESRTSTHSSNSLPLMMHLASRAKRGPQLAPERERHTFWLRQISLSIVGGAIAIASVLIGLTLYNHLSTRTLEQQRELLQTTNNQETQRYQQFLATLPQLPTNLETLRRITAGIDQLGAHRADPGNAFDIISHALDHYPDITVKLLDWQLSNPDQGSTTTILSAVLPLAAAADPGTSLQRIRALAAELNHTDAETSLLNLPFEMSPDKTLRSHSETSSKRPEFTLRLRLTKGSQP
ncbi:MAG: hypothetical protein H6R19_3352 [Proteobacteria bacterium]|nr:hypothetical protein [Pseudomonadota bacterium]